MNKILLLLLCLLLLPLPGPARERPFVDQSDSTDIQGPEKPAWREQRVELPGPFKEGDLVGFELDQGGGRFSYFIDRTSLRAGSDGVVRVRLVIRSSSGAVNSSYEGYRCGESQYKVYAYGGARGLRATHQADWRPIPKNGPENYRKTLYDDLLCNLDTGRPNPAEAVIEAMRQKRKVTDFFTQD